MIILESYMDKQVSARVIHAHMERKVHLRSLSLTHTQTHTTHTMLNPLMSSADVYIPSSQYNTDELIASEAPSLPLISIISPNTHSQGAREKCAGTNPIISPYLPVCRELARPVYIQLHSVDKYDHLETHSDAHICVGWLHTVYVHKLESRSIWSRGLQLYRRSSSFAE